MAPAAKGRVSFDPNSPAAARSGVFGLPFEEKESALVYFPVPWEATVSYGVGTAQAPRALLKASHQVDLFDSDVLKPYEAGLFMRSESSAIRALNRKAKAPARKVIAAGGVDGRKDMHKAAGVVDALSDALNGYVYKETSGLMADGKIVGVVGGDHSTPYGAIQAATEREPGLGILHFDAHHDMRRAYEGFRYSHASIFYNVLTDFPGAAKLVQVGVRDFCEEEFEFCAAQGGRVRVFYDSDISRRRFMGEPWDRIASEIVSELPKKVWISFDIDGLDARFCPHTGTPVPGGIDFNEAIHVLRALVRSGRRIAGFDLVEVAPGPRGSEWDANVGARLLYKLSAWTLASRGLARIR